MAGPPPLYVCGQTYSVRRRLPITVRAMTPDAQTAQATKFIAALLVAIIVAAAVFFYVQHVHNASVKADNKSAAQECKVDIRALDCP